MHTLMTEEYLARRQQSIDQQKAAKAISIPDKSHSFDRYTVTPADLVPTMYPEDDKREEMDELVGEEENTPVYGCQHYMRNVKVQCFDCHRWFPCRHCHDASPDLPFPHSLNRKKTENMLCMLCHTPQPAGEVCTSCGQDTAYYYCDICKLWDNDSTKRIYHCDDCGICRRGEGLGRDYVHCKRCNVCISISTSSTHPCIERATECDCPLCLDFLFSSATPVVSLFCGHYMHASCYKDLMNVTYRCPVCNKSAVNMELQWRKLDDEIRYQPMPEEDFDELDDEASTPALLEDTDSRLSGGLNSLRLVNESPRRQRRVPRRVWVGCNDCGGKGWTNFHWLGLKCPVCDGYNTNQMLIPISDDRWSAPLPGTQRQRQHDFTGVDAIRSFGGDVDSVEIVDERADSAYAFATSPSQQPTQPSGVPVPRRSYFFRAEEEELASRPPSSSGQDGRFLSYDGLLQRFSRSLSPMRTYIEGFDAQERAVSAGRAISDYAASMAGNGTRSDTASEELRGRAEGAIDHGTGLPPSGEGHENEVYDGRSDNGSVSSEGEDDDDDDDESLDDFDPADPDTEPDNADEDEMELFGHR